LILRISIEVKMNSVGQRIKTARKIKGVSQKWVASCCGWKCRANLSHYETGRNVAPLESLKLIAHALKVSPRWLCFGEGEMADV
jgi:transcriptional regulator with XRE-family HTH domain